MELPSAIISNPPRQVPFSTRLVVLFGGMFSLLGWVFAGFGMLFAIMFVGNADFSSLIYFRGSLETASGVVAASEQTHASEGGSKHSRGTPIYRYHYHFNAGGMEYQGVSYHTGEAAQTGATVTVEFPAGKPACSRIQGMRRAIFGPGASLVLIFPVIGLVFIVISLRGGMKNLSLLINGEATLARFTSQEATKTIVNGKPVFKVWFQFTDRTGALQTTFTRTTTPEKLEATAFEPLFFDPNHPARTTLLHNLPGNISLDERGAVKPLGTGAAFSAVWPVALAAVFVVAAIFLRQLMPA